MCQSCFEYWQQSQPPATGFSVKARLVLHVALEIMHNKNECRVFVTRGAGGGFKLTVNI